MPAEPGRRVRVLVGLLAVALGLVCGSGAFAAVSPVLVTPDETAHVDYGYQVWHGRLPVFEDGITFVPGPGARVPPVQWAAQHPPLYYLLIAPAVGPLIDAGQWREAVLAARGVNVALAVACLAALAWAGSLVSRRRRWAWAIAVPAAVAPISPFMRVGGSAYNDNLSTLLSTLALGLALLVLRRGPTTRRLVAVAAVCGLGWLARGSFAVTLLVVAAALAAGTWRHGRGRAAARLVASLLAAAVPPAAGLLAAGWFYRRNIRLTGSWTGGHPDWAHANLGRDPATIVEVLGNRVFWREKVMLLRQPAPGTADWLGPWVLLALAAAAALAGLVWLVRARSAARAGRPGGAPEPVGVGDRGADQAAVVLVLVAQTALVLALDVLYVSAGGAPITRYLLAALLPIGCVLAAGVLAAGRRAAGAALLGYLLVAWGLFVHWLWRTPGGLADAGPTRNGTPTAWVWAAVAGLGVAVVVQAVALTDWGAARRSRASPAPVPPGPGERWTEDMDAWPTSVIAPRQG